MRKRVITLVLAAVAALAALAAPAAVRADPPHHGCDKKSTAYENTGGNCFKKVPGNTPGAKHGH